MLVIGKCTVLVKKKTNWFCTFLAVCPWMNNCVPQGLYLLSLLGKMGIMMSDTVPGLKWELENTTLSKAWILLLKASILSPGPGQRAGGTSSQGDSQGLAAGPPNPPAPQPCSLGRLAQRGAAAAPRVSEGPGRPYLLSVSSSGYLSITLMMSSTTSPTHRICFSSMMLLPETSARSADGVPPGLCLLSRRIVSQLPESVLAPPPRPELLLQGASCSGEVQRTEPGSCSPHASTPAGLGVQTPRSWSLASP